MAGAQLSGKVCEALSPVICPGKKGKKEKGERKEGSVGGREGGEQAGKYLK